MRNDYDAIVIGSGITGGWAAKELKARLIRPLGGYPFSSIAFCLWVLKMPFHSLIAGEAGMPESYPTFSVILLLLAITFIISFAYPHYFFRFCTYTVSSLSHYTTSRDSIHMSRIIIDRTVN